RQARSGQYPTRADRRIRRGRQPRCLSRLGSRLFCQRHDDRDRWRAGQGPDGPHARPVRMTKVREQLAWQARRWHYSSRDQRGGGKNRPRRGMTTRVSRRPNRSAGALVATLRIASMIAAALAVGAGARPAAAADVVMKFGTATINETQHQFIKFYKDE